MTRALRPALLPRQMSDLPDGPWSVAQGWNGDLPLVMRINTGVAACRSDLTLRHRIGVAVPLNAPRDDGFPDAAEGEMLNQIEDALCLALEVGQQAVEVLVLTTAGMREFVFHTRAPESLDAAIDAVRGQFASHVIQCILEDDPEWAAYREFTE